MPKFVDIFSASRQSMLALLGGRSLWGFADQLLISFTNFVTMVLVAKGLHKAAFGEFTLIYSALLFANILQFALITQPHNVIGSSRDGEDYCLYTTATALMQILLAMALGGIASGVAIGAGHYHANFTPELIALVPGIVTWQLQEFFRRVLYTEGRMAAAFVNDLVSYGAQTAIIAMFWWQARLTGALALWALAITSGIAALIGLAQIRKSLRPHISKQAILDNWHFGKWLLGSEVLQWCSSLQMYLYLAALILGTAASGTLRAAQILFGPARVFSFLLQSLLPIRFSRALASDGPDALSAQMRRAFVLVLVLLGPYCLVLAVMPNLVLRVVFDPSYAEHPFVLSLFSLQSMMTYFVMVLAAALSAMRMTRDIFLASVCSALVSLALSWPFIKMLGVGGAVACMMASSLAMATFLTWRYRAKTQPIAEPAFPVVFTEEEQACPS